MFRKATKSQAKARIALCGPAGSGKTYSALTIAKHLGPRVAVIDTEHGSASKYAGDVADFDVCELDTFSPAAYREAIRDAEKAGYDVIVIDSLSHGWSGEGGVLEMVDNVAAAKTRGNSFAAWKDVTPEHRKLVEAIVGCRAHVIATMRVKTEYVIEENEKGKKMPRKIGMAPEQKAGLEYEFDVVGELDAGILTITKSRCAALSDKRVRHPGREFAEQIRDWLSDGTVPLHEELVASVAECGDVDSLATWCQANVGKLRGLKNSSRAMAWNAIADKGAALGLGEDEVKGMLRAKAS